MWTLTSGMDVASAHLTLTDDAGLDDVLNTARQRLHDRYGITHATVQVESKALAATCHRIGW